MAFPPPQQPGFKPPDTTVDAYERIVNGQVVKVSAYGKKPSASTTAAVEVRKLPGRPRMMATPGTYSSGRDLPGVKAAPPKPEPVQAPFQQKVPNGSPPQVR